MDIERAKALCEEHDRLETTVKVIIEAAENHWWIAVKTPGGESYLSNAQARAVLSLAETRMKEIEDLIK